MNKERFSRREWFLVLAVVMMIEYWVISVSYDFADDQALINYVSFGATLASLLLAIVAIIYGFIQSDSSSRASSVIREQADELKDATEGLSSSILLIEAHLQKVAMVTDKLDGVDVSINGSIEKLSRLEDKVGELHLSQSEALKEFLQKKDKPSVAQGVQGGVTGTFTAEQIFKIILRQTSYPADLLGYALNKYVENGDSLKYFDFYEKYYKISLPNDAVGSSNVFFNCTPILKVIGAIDYDAVGNVPLTVSESFKSLLQSFAEKTRKETAERVSVGVSAIDKVSV